MPTLELVFRAARQSDGTYRGTVVIPALPGVAAPEGLPIPAGATPKALAVTAKAPSKKAAIEKAGKLANAALSNPMVQAVLPPQAKMALTAAKGALKVGKKLRKLF